MGGAAPTEGGTGGGGGGGGGGGDALVKPWRVRLVDLPFSAVEWIVTEEDMHKVCVVGGGGVAGGGRGCTEEGGFDRACLARGAL
jgi:hypothetical protein